VGLTPHPHLVPKVLEKSRAIPLLTPRVYVAYKKGRKPTKLFISVGLFFLIYFVALRPLFFYERRKREVPIT
jgi:hypothetical protein